MKLKNKKNNKKTLKSKEVKEVKKVKLNIGCGDDYLNDWINIDNNPYNSIEKLDLHWDLTKSLPFKDNSVDLICDNHFFKKMELGDSMIESALWNYRCMLKPDGVLQIPTPLPSLNGTLEPWLNKLGFPHVNFSSNEPSSEVTSLDKLFFS